MKSGLSTEAIQRINKALMAVVPNFSASCFRKKASAKIEELELRERVDFLIDLMATYLPDDFTVTAELLYQIPDHWDLGKPDDPLSEFAAWPIIDYVGQHGLEHPVIALNLLKRLTPLFTAEFAVRPFLQQHTKLTLQTLADWCNNPDEHVRRLVSEGTRPRLPWGCRLKIFIEDPKPVFSLLEQLKNDASETVRRSVANNLNDIAKDHPELVIDRCSRWAVNADSNRQWIIRHATRTLVKQGYPSVFGLLGFTEAPDVSIEDLTLSHDFLEVGKTLKLNFKLISNTSNSQRIVVDYAVHYLKANGKLNPKVFKLKNVNLAAGEQQSIRKQHSFRHISTRKYYPGLHIVEILINGKGILQKEFTLTNSA